MIRTNFHNCAGIASMEMHTGLRWWISILTGEESTEQICEGVLLHLKILRSKNRIYKQITEDAELQVDRAKNATI